MFLENMLFESLLSSSCLQNQLTIKIYVEKLSIVMIHILYLLYCTPIMCNPSLWEGLFCVCYRYCDIALFVILINFAYFANNFLKCDQSRKSFLIFPLAGGQTTPPDLGVVTYVSVCEGGGALTARYKMDTQWIFGYLIKL